MDDAQVKQILEAVLFVFGEPVALKRLCEIMPEIDSAQLRRCLQALDGEYTSSGRAFHIQEVAGGYQLVTDHALAGWVRRALSSPKPDSVSKSALETLAIIAYRQPITKAEIEAIRGVDVTASLETLVERKFVRAAGRKESPGRPYLYGTTPEFLRHFGLKSIEALPPMAQPTLTEPGAQEPAAASSGPPEPASIAATERAHAAAAPNGQ